MTTRRHFLRNAGLAALAAAVGPTQSAYGDYLASGEAGFGTRLTEAMVLDHRLQGR